MQARNNFAGLWKSGSPVPERAIPGLKMANTVEVKPLSDDGSQLDQEATMQDGDQPKQSEFLPRTSTTLTVDDLEAIADPDEPRLPKELTYWQGTALIISRQIGSGIFSMVALVNGNSGSMGMSLLIWIVTGCIAYCGACLFAPSTMLTSSIVCGIGDGHSI